MKNKNTSLIFFLSQSLFIGVGLRQILSISKTDSIISIIIGGLFSLTFLKKKVNKNIISVIIFTFFFIYNIWNINSYIGYKYLNNTPSYIIIFIFLIPVLYLSMKDNKTILKVSNILFIISLIELILSFSNLSFLIEIDNFKPIFNSSVFNILKGSFIFMSYFSIPLFLVSSDSYSDYLISIIFFITLFIFIIGIYGIDLASLFYYPEFHLMKKISFFNFIEHVENIFSINYISSIFISCVLSLKYIKEYFKDKYYFIVIISFLLSIFLFKNPSDGYIFIEKYFVFMIIPIIFMNLKRNKN